MRLNISLFEHKRDATPRAQVIEFPSGLDDFREADARTLRTFLDYNHHPGKPPAPDKSPGKNGPLWSPALFNGRRSKDTVVSVCALVLDYDYGDIDPGEVVERWAHYTHVLHSTYTPGRYRLILPYPAPVDVETHDRMYAWALAQDARLDGSVSDASRAFYWPTCRVDLDIDPVFGYNEGELLDPSRTGLDLPRTTVRPGSSGSPPTRIQRPPLPEAGPERAGRGNTGGAPADSTYAGIEHAGQREDLALIESRCGFMRRVRADMHRPDGDPARVTQPEWYAALSIVGRCRGGDELAHEVSASYPGYTYEETESVYRRAVASSGPRTCADIRRLSPLGCRGCALQVTSPVLLGRSEPVPPAAPAAEASAGGDEPPDLATALAEADALYRAARLQEDAAIVGVEAAKKRLRFVRADRVASEQDLADAVAAVSAAQEQARAAERTRRAREREAADIRRRTSAAGLPPGADPGVWARLRMNREGAPANVITNLMTIVEEDPRFSSRLHYDVFANEVCLDGAALPEEQGTRLAVQVGRSYHLDTSTNALLEVVRAVAMERQRHPIREWLDGLRWDGTPRLHELMLRGFGAQPKGDEELVVRIGEQFILSLLARAYQAGAKVDTMLVLTGRQGMYKSTSFETLVGQRWFLSTKLDLHNKDSFIQLRGKWLVEFGEMAAVKKADDNVAKGWITNKVDTYRAPYAKRAEDHPRSTVVCGSSNERELLQDPTGYRRFRPVEVHKADIGWLAEYREQLFAEACVVRAAGGERAKWWFDEDTEWAERMRRFAAPYQVTHPWTETISTWLERSAADPKLELFSATQVLTLCLGFSVADIDRRQQTDVGTVLHAIGCTRVDRGEEHGAWTTRYRRPTWMLERRAAGGRPAGASVVNIAARS